LGLVLAILFQCACFIWYGAKIDAQVSITKNDVSSLQSWRENQSDEKSKIESHLAVIDVQLKDTNDKLSDQTKILQKIDDKLQTGRK
jgi:septal ring factor EnvC (AmiA/AmiB activator)